MQRCTSHGICTLSFIFFFLFPFKGSDGYVLLLILRQIGWNKLNKVKKFMVTSSSMMTLFVGTENI